VDHVKNQLNSSEERARQASDANASQVDVRRAQTHRQSCQAHFECLLEGQRVRLGEGVAQPCKPDEHCQFEGQHFAAHWRPAACDKRNSWR